MSIEDEKRVLVERHSGKNYPPRQPRRTGRGFMPLSLPDQEAVFWSRVVIKESGCWEWSGNTIRSGYGSISWGHPLSKSKVYLSHRFSWLLTYGEIPDGLNVLHKCDNPPCVNPNHLFLGTQADNARDRESKGRSNSPVGERSSLHKLKSQDVLEIRCLATFGAHLSFLASKFGVTRKYLHRIVKRKTWKHV